MSTPVIDHTRIEVETHSRLESIVAALNNQSPDKSIWALHTNDESYGSSYHRGDIVETSKTGAYNDIPRRIRIEYDVRLNRYKFNCARIPELSGFRGGVDTSITVTGAKSDTQIAADVIRRFLPEYNHAFQIVTDMFFAEKAASAQQLVVAAEIESIGGQFLTRHCQKHRGFSEDSGGILEYPTEFSLYHYDGENHLSAYVLADLKVTDTNVEFSKTRVPVELGKRILEQIIAYVQEIEAKNK